ncbi:hypothetical protein [Phytohabitans aurantiacus]|jgi:hypothetical protein|uniref:DUF4345 domain-containing protein n=1 Tax=Phytohabitans aurantiacus TaxID=3016789 RepID=A0ABQ5R575_9ACTN|nr:hypothetical protein [Phytohabitans aurantiacus]GLI01906.1 hypothetical protein Pa4123_71830 [Phytohabitans aurantiacus]
MQDELFNPTIREQPAPGKPPWRPESILYPAFFGGPLAAAALGLLNGGRLALPAPHLVAIGAAGLVGFGARLAIAASVEGNAPVRYGAVIAGILVSLVVLAFQRKPFRAYTYRGGEPASLVAPGIGAAIGFGVLEAILILVLVR